MKQFMVAMVFLVVMGAHAEQITTPVLVHRDGEASVTGYVGSEKEIVVDGGADKVVGWLTFQTEGVDFTAVAQATVALYVKSLDVPGEVRVHALTSAISVPENHVTLSELNYDTTTLASATLSTADVEQVIRFDVTTQVVSGSFHGVVLEADEGLFVTFSSKEGTLQPMLLVSYDVAASVWHTGDGVPLGTLGDDGDLYLDQQTGDVYRKSTGAWNVASNLTGPQGPAGVTGPEGPQGPIGITWRGTWDTVTSYIARDAVYHTGSAYVCVSDGPTEAPGVDAGWELLAAQGEMGPQGPEGVSSYAAISPLVISNNSIRLGPGSSNGDLLSWDGNHWVAAHPTSSSKSVMQPYLTVNYCIALQGIFPSRSFSEPFLGTIAMFGFNFAPRGWAQCDGQLLSISTNSALFSLLGTTYGGDGRTTFALPDLRGRVPLHQGTVPGLTQRRMGQRGGSETTTVTEP